MKSFVLGNLVEDIVTGFTGIAISRIVYLTGCAQIGVSPRVAKDNKPESAQYFDETRIRFKGKGVAQEMPEPVMERGGPNRDMPQD